MRVSWSSWSVKISQLGKSSRYQIKRVSVASHMQCVHHKGCSSKAVSGIVLELFLSVCITEFTVGKEFTVRKEFMVQQKKSEQSSPHVVRASHEVQQRSCVR